MTGLEVRTATFTELEPRTAYRIWQLRESVFVVEQNCAYQELDGRDLEPSTWHVWVEHEEVPVAYLRVLDDGDESRIGRVVVSRPWRGQGVAEALMRTTLEQLGGRPVRLDAQAYLTGWYERLGFTVVGPRFLDDGIPHVPMRRVV